MRKRLKLLYLSVFIISGLLVVVSPLFFFAASATYVEGHITLDTIWTLTDSPFVLSKDVIVDPGVTLTIMPGVEVRFAENFALIVKGKLAADGTQDKWITFTSNKEQPTAGDWNTIQFIDGTQPSTLTYCLIEYATNGATIQNSNVKIMNSEIRHNSMSAIAIENGYVEVMNNEISDSGDGIYVTGDSQVTIKENTLKSNLNGIFLTGNLTRVVDIRQNKVLLNNQSGIQLDMDAYASLTILYNTLSSNEKGFYVSGRAKAYITNNSIAYNKVGIFYQSGNATTPHEAHYNDIYGNDFGMNVLLQATVNAMYNYWGDSSGPYHVSLNPSGKGNQVGGDGINLDFIPFLTAPIGYINERPTAELLTDKNLVPPNEPVTFIATTSSDDKRVDQYFFNFGDGKNSGWTTLSVFVYKYSSIGNYSANVIVMDDFGVTSNNVATSGITVKAGLMPHDTSLTLSRSSINSGGQVSITIHATEGASIRLMSDRKGSFVPSSGTTNTTGYFTATFTAPSVTERSYVRITATASKAGYADGSDYEYLVVLPLLVIEVTADPVAIKSEATSNVTVHVTHNSNPISDAIVTLSSDGGGSFNPEIGTANANGSVTFTFTAPQVITQLNVTVTATATKSSYFEGKGQTTITVNPRTLVVQVTANPNTIESSETTKVVVHVTEGSIPIEGANVTVSYIGGTFSAHGNTDSKGDFKLNFTAPQTTTQLNLTITANATKSEYVKGEGQTTILVNPIPGPEPISVSGLPLTTILMIVIPIIVVVIVAILFKTKVITLSREES